MVAEGALDATFIKPNAQDWDLAAADLILAEAGGQLLEPSGRRPVYATANPRHGVLVAGGGPLLAAMVEAIASIDGWHSLKRFCWRRFCSNCPSALPDK